MSGSDTSTNVESPEPTRDDMPIISKPAEDVSDVPGIAVIDPIILKQRQTTAVGKVTRKRNDLVKLMLSADNLHEAKTQLTEYDELFVLYQGAHNMLYDVLTDEDLQDKESARYREHESEISIFRQQVLNWISDAERKLSDELDRLSDLCSRRSGSSRVSSRSRAGSTQSARAHEKAKLAALLVEREQQSKQLELQLKRQALQAEEQKLQAEEQKLQLDLEISKTLAREHAYTEDLESKLQLNVDHSSVYVEPHNHDYENVHVAMNDVNDNVATNVATNVVTNVATNVVPNVKSIDDMITQNNQSHIHAESNDNTGHIYVNAVNNNPAPSTGTSSIATKHHNMRIPETTSHTYNHQAEDVHHNFTTQPARRGTTSQLNPPGTTHTTHTLNPSAACYQSTPHVEQYDFRATIQQLVTAMTLPQPEVPKFSGDPTEYHTFMMAFDAQIVSRTANYSDRLYYLNQYLVGEAKDFVSGCLHMDPTYGYPEARRILDKEYGDLYKISSVYINQVMSWSTIRPDDSISLRKFSIFLNKCHKAMNNIADLTVLNHMPNLQAIVSKLPGHLQNKWREHANRTKRHDHRIPNFQDLTSFVEIASESANDPVFGKAALSKYSASASSSTPVAKWKSTPTRKSFAVTLHQPDMRRGTNTNQSTIQRNTSMHNCHLCHKAHDLDTCYAFMRKTHDERRAFLMENRLCFACFGLNHTSRGCLQKRTCSKCNKKHPTSLHMENYQPSYASDKTQYKQPTTAAAVNKPDETIQTNTCRITNEDNSTVLQTIIPVKVHQQGCDNSVITYAFYDNGSTGCFLSDDLMDQLNATGHNTALVLRTMNGDTRVTSTAVNGLVVSSITGDNPILLPKCFTRDEIPVGHSQIPKPDVLTRWAHLREATSNMAAYLPDVHIGLLIGSNCPKALQPIKVIPSYGEGPFAVMYPHGWTINGPLRINRQGDGTSKVTYCNRITVQEIQIKEVITSDDILRLFDADFDDLNFNDVPGKLGPSQEDNSFMKKAESGIQHVDGHYILPLPFREHHIQMPFNRSQAVKRASWQRKKMLANEAYHDDYTTFVNNLLDHGYAKKIPPNEITSERGKSWYLPHHGVYHPTKSKICVVFDCSAKFQGASLNDHLLQGPDLTNTLIGVLTRFRQEPIAIIGDIEAMFHQVRVIKEHHNFLRFLWWPQGDLNQDLEEYAMVVHLFGATSSPSIANFALKRAADEAEQHINSEVAETIRRNFYVDDCLKAVSTEAEAIRMVSDLQAACKLGGFKIAKFSSNSANVLSSIPLEDRSKELQVRSLDYRDLPSERALGVYWDVNKDSFSFSIKTKDKPPTRRGILSTVSSVYDPLGFIAPFILYAKRILQDLCREEHLEWDEAVPDDYVIRWCDWLKQLPLLRDVHVSRCVKPTLFGDIVSAQIHVFSDASSVGYGSVAYMRLVDMHGSIHCSFLMGKARLAPIKQTTIPRLELTAATVAVRLGRSILQELDMRIDHVFYYTDSTTVLHYLLNRKKRFPIFIANRVQFILDYSSTDDWRFIDTKINPADYASRGMSTHDIMQNEEWLKGPDFIWMEASTWPSQPTLAKDYAIIEDNVISTAVTAIDESANTMKKFIEYFSDWFRLKHAMAVYHKLMLILKHRKHSPNDVPPNYHISAIDIAAAEHVIIKYVQSQHFRQEILHLTRKDSCSHGRVLKTSTIYKLDPFLQQGLLRVGGRLSKSNIQDSMKYPILLPQKSHVTMLIIRSTHRLLAHAGRNHVLARLRETYWVIHANATVRSMISTCVTCRKLRKPVTEQKMADLPPERCSTSPPFTYTGVDLFGPFMIKQGRKEQKRYGVLFTCLASRAVHIEITASLNTDSFLQALRRCIARRGPITQLRCDNGTNFVGAERELRKALNEMNDDHIQRLLLKHNIQWIFNPPAASHMGGSWERQIRTVRKVMAQLSREFGDMFDDESFHTLMCEVETIINSRPITTPSADPNDLEALTPNHILTMKTGVILPPPGTFQHADIYLRKRWRRVQYAANIFWTRWRREYLLTLQHRQKWSQSHRNMTQGDIVVIKDDSLPRNRWAMGRITETEPDRKGVVRSVTVKTSTNKLRRPVDRLVLLIPVEEQLHN